MTILDITICVQNVESFLWFIVFRDTRSLCWMRLNKNISKKMIIVLFCLAPGLHKCEFYWCSIVSMYFLFVNPGTIRVLIVMIIFHVGFATIHLTALSNDPLTYICSKINCLIRVYSCLLVNGFSNVIRSMHCNKIDTGLTDWWFVILWCLWKCCTTNFICCLGKPNKVDMNVFWINRDMRCFIGAGGCCIEMFPDL